MKHGDCSVMICEWFAESGQQQVAIVRETTNPELKKQRWEVYEEKVSYAQRHWPKLQDNFVQNCEKIKFKSDSKPT